LNGKWCCRCRHTFLCSAHLLQGANIDRGNTVAFFAGIAGAVLIALLRKRPTLVIAILLLASAALGLAIVLVSLDSATYVEGNVSCMFSAVVPTETAHVGGLYWAWGSTIVLLDVQAIRLALQSPPEPPTSRYEQPGWLQLPPSEEG
jgi:hypothetical protein